MCINLWGFGWACALRGSHHCSCAQALPARVLISVSIVVESRTGHGRVVEGCGGERGSKDSCAYTQMKRISEIASNLQCPAARLASDVVID
ncbi:hypothetical protein EVAR_87980_1 [Eumeta japonica]|uniref:Secreted protein n=1 Tax=Eumeta variegata TaxID=151549 RepID=A0A4C1VC22_EUMVA|nr:hypothetical protein EVAR_87980_1 [Eumeta japonica]